MPAALSRPLKIGTDCSGMETPIMALLSLGVSFKHMFSSDNDKNVKIQSMPNFTPKIWFDDLMERDNSASSTPAVDLYVAGFPCQSFSTAGNQLGFEDTRGTVFYGCCEYIDNKRPRAFMLENVKGLVSHDGGNTFEQVMDSLTGIGNGAYWVTYKILNTLDHGVPQNRERIYIIGIRKDCRCCKFAFPEPLPRVSIESCLDPVKRKPTLEDLPPKSNKTAFYNVKQVVKKLTKDGKEPLKNPFVIDLDASIGFRSVMLDKTMCMTKSRPNGYWVSNRGRRMNIDEMLRCQGMERSFKQIVSDRVLGCQIGNAMSQNVMERLLIILLPAAGLVQQNQPLVDRWLKKAKAATSNYGKRAASAHASSRPAAKRTKVA